MDLRLINLIVKIIILSIDNVSIEYLLLARSTNLFKYLFIFTYHVHLQLIYCLLALNFYFLKKKFIYNFFFHIFKILIYFNTFLTKINFKKNKISYYRTLVNFYGLEKVVLVGHFLFLLFSLWLFPRAFLWAVE